jgi:N-acetylneuraminate synthase
MLEVYRARYGCPVGLSDHSGAIYAALAAAALGCDLVEVHVTLSRQMFGPDVTSSVTTAELRALVDGIRFIECARANPVDKDAAAREAEPMRRLFTKSVVARVDLPPGTVLGPEHLALRKPGTGIPPARLGDLAGRRLRHAVAGGTLLAWEDLE